MFYKVLLFLNFFLKPEFFQKYSCQKKNNFPFLFSLALRFVQKKKSL
ncbi:hypothetical protein FG167_10865 [Lacinutrix sp. WUR7]|nr:hypothetical protein FG167_10865 [Lacinutrix sp. WUR7]